MISQNYKQNNSRTHLRVLSVVHGKDIQYSIAAYIELTKTSLVTMLNILESHSETIQNRKNQNIVELQSHNLFAYSLSLLFSKCCSVNVIVINESSISEEISP